MKCSLHINAAVALIILVCGTVKSSSSTALLSDRWRMSVCVRMLYVDIITSKVTVQ